MPVFDTCRMPHRTEVDAWLLGMQAWKVIYVTPHLPFMLSSLDCNPMVFLGSMRHPNIVGVAPYIKDCFEVLGAF